ncbi:MAG: efflux RND transporter periplasmic adaptor subunit [bacterium]|nr:efflux RND transporter periplasmic adaptor subunit [bacterium]
MTVWYRKPWFFIAVLACIAGTAWIVVAQRGSEAPAYDTFLVAPRDVVREVATTGTVEAADTVALAFSVSGRIARVAVAVGDRVAAGAVLVTLEQADLFAARAQEEAAAAAEHAELAALRIGTRTEELRVKEASRENAQRSLADAEGTLANVIAKANADLAAHYDSAPNVLRDAYTKADDAVRKQTDELFMNDATDNPQLTFQTADMQAEIDAERDRRGVEVVLQRWPSRTATLESIGDSELDAMLAIMTADASTIRSFLERASAAVNAASNINQATITAYKANIGTARANIDTVQAAVDDQIQDIALQRVTNHNAVAAAQADVTIARNALVAADAALALARAAATPETIAVQEAAVAAANARVARVDADLAKTVLRAPFGGVASVVDANAGAIATVGAPLVTILADAAFEITANIPEVDLAGLAVGQMASVTLDAYGSEEVFRTTLVSIDPAATLVEGVPTYKTTLVFDETDDRIRAGMTADVTIAVDQRMRVLAIPQRAIIRREGIVLVRVLRGDWVEEVPVSVGLRGSDGFIEIVDGLDAGDTIVRSFDVE